MDSRFSPHNLHRDASASFEHSDPHLRRLRERALVWESPLLREFPDRTPGIYTLGGARQIGKSTLVKQWMSRLLSRGAQPERVVYMTGELIDDHHTLVRLLQDEIDVGPGGGPCFVAIDEVSYVRRWDRAIKFLVDAGVLERCVLLLTGSDLSMIREARVLLPGRRGKADRVDFHLQPLTYAETCTLKGVLDRAERHALEDVSGDSLPDLTEDAWVRVETALDDYLVHGGFLTAMNDVAETGVVRRATQVTYSDWIRGDVLKRGKRETYLREILGAIIRRLGSRVTWNALARDLSIDHPATVADYVHLLQSMDAFFVQPALREDRLAAAPKKARKIVPCDPFIVHAVRSWLDPAVDPHGEVVLPFVRDPERAGALVESCVAGHARRQFPTFYIKSTGEVDVALVHGGRFWPIEVKWRGRHRRKDFRQISKYPNGFVAGRTRSRHEVEGVPLVPLPQVLALLGKGRWPPGSPR